MRARLHRLADRPLARECAGFQIIPGIDRARFLGSGCRQATTPLVVHVPIEAGQIWAAAGPGRPRRPEDASRRTHGWLAIEGTSRDHPGGAAAGSVRKRGTAGPTKADREALGAGEVVTLDPCFAGEPLEIVGISQEIRRVTASSSSATSRAVAVNEETPGATDPVANATAETAALDLLRLNHLRCCLTAIKWISPHIVAVSRVGSKGAPWIPDEWIRPARMAARVWLVRSVSSPGRPSSSEFQASGGFGRLGRWPKCRFYSIWIRWYALNIWPYMSVARTSIV